jgi:hypothetical protein
MVITNFWFTNGFERVEGLAIGIVEKTVFVLSQRGSIVEVIMSEAWKNERTQRGIR